MPVVAAASTGPAGRPGFVAQALIIITGPWSRIVLFVAFVEGAAGFGALAIWASHLHRALGLSLSAAGAIVALFGLGGMLYMAVARHLIHRLGERGLAMLGVLLPGLSALVLGFTPYWLPTLPASLLVGFGFFMFHNTMQANATQMAPAARGTAVSLFASALFLGQSVGVLLAAGLTERIGSGTVIALAGGVLVAIGCFFAQALRRRDELTRPQ
jgi:predicted MFS family arabinose efflux permease